MADRDFYTGVEYLQDQSGANGVLTFNFTKSVQMVFVRAAGDVTCRATSNGVEPTASLGVPVPDEPTPLLNITEAVKVYAPVGAVVSVWGYRY